MNNIIFIVGPTATGKTEVACELARRIKAEILSCDSMLIYKEPRILTAKPEPKQLEEIPHHFIDIISVEEPYSVFDYYRDCTRKIEELHAKKVPVIVCGGSGLYAKALLDGIFQGAGKDEGLRASLEEQAKGTGLMRLYEELKKADEVSARKISANDKRRIIRALEVYKITGIPLSEKKKSANGLWGQLPIKIFALKLPRPIMYERIERRVDWMLEHGAIEEASALRRMKLSLTAEKIIGIKELGDYLDGKCTIEEAATLMKMNTRRFAKRQVTWFGADARIKWLAADNKTPEQLRDDILAYLA
ncbi:MAG: tRNA (adenosine(37)-N6)-dimethylallyltransferase MiaA [Candidatus Omnitrophica bacterium]|nr:tRNA (adenosine(37)-N6)-dimethylallyltransferase MiaA [Candidatus Omnitrophota bacterium]